MSVQAARNRMNPTCLKGGILKPDGSSTQSGMAFGSRGLSAASCRGEGSSATSGAPSKAPRAASSSGVGVVDWNSSSNVFGFESVMGCASHGT